MVCGNATQQSIGMQAVTHGLGIGLAVCGETSRMRLLLRADQALHPKIPHRLVAAPATEDEINGWKHVSLRHLGDHELIEEVRVGRLRGTALAFMPFRSSQDLAVGVQPGSLIVEERMQTFGAAEAELQRHRAVILVTSCVRP